MKGMRVLASLLCNFFVCVCVYIWVCVCVCVSLCFTEWVILSPHLEPVRAPYPIHGGHYCHRVCHFERYPVMDSSLRWLNGPWNELARFFSRCWWLRFCFDVDDKRCACVRVIGVHWNAAGCYIPGCTLLFCTFIINFIMHNGKCWSNVLWHHYIKCLFFKHTSFSIYIRVIYINFLFALKYVPLLRRLCAFIPVDGTTFMETGNLLYVQVFVHVYMCACACVCA